MLLKKTDIKTILFGDWLVRRGLIDRRQLFAALNYSYLWDIRVGDAVVELRYLGRDLIEQEAVTRETFLAFGQVSPLLG